MVLEHSVDKEHLKQIGDIIVSFALLENNIEFLIWISINETQRIGQIITAELSFKNLRALAISLHLEKSGKNDDFVELESLMSKAGTLEEKRNKIIHSLWCAGKDKDHRMTMKITAKQKKGFKCNFIEYSVNDLSNFAKEIRDLAEKIQIFCTKQQLPKS